MKYFNLIQKVSDAAPVADDLILTATPYVDNPLNATTPGIATWEVATSADFSTGLMTDTQTLVRDNRINSEHRKW